MTTIKETIDLLADSLAADAVIERYCLAKYAKKQTVQVGQVAETPAVQGDMPVLVIGMPGGRYSNELRTYEFPLAVGITNNSVLGKYYVGAVEAAELAELVAEEITLLPLKVTISMPAPPVTSIFPVFYALLTCTIEKKKPLRPVRA